MRKNKTRSKYSARKGRNWWRLSPEQRLGKWSRKGGSVNQRMGANGHEKRTLKSENYGTNSMVKRRKTRQRIGVVKVHHSMKQKRKSDRLRVTREEEKLRSVGVGWKREVDEGRGSESRQIWTERKNFPQAEKRHV